MANDLKGWKVGLKPVIRAQLPLKLEVKDEGGETMLKALSDGKEFQKQLQIFVTEQFLPFLQKEYKARADKGEEYWPHYLSKFHDYNENLPVIYGEKNDQYRDAGGRRGYTVRLEDRGVNMDSGFSELWQAIAAKPVVETTSTGGAVAHIGNMSSIMALKLSDFMGQQGSKYSHSPLNSLFRAVEFGTGVAENVGGEFVRLDGDTKDRSGRYGPGAWWFFNPRKEDAGAKFLRETTGSAEQGALFTGQKGFHFLTDARRNPKEMYRKLFIDKFPIILRKALTGTGVGFAR